MKILQYSFQKCDLYFCKNVASHQFLNLFEFLFLVLKDYEFEVMSRFTQKFEFQNLWIAFLYQDMEYISLSYHNQAFQFELLR